MGKGDSSKSTTTNNENLSGATQQSGEGNFSLAGIKGNVTVTDRGSVKEAINLVTDANDNMTELADKSIGASLESQNIWSQFAQDIVQETGDQISENQDKAFNAIGTNTQLITDATRSEGLDLLQTGGKYAMLSVVAIAVAYAVANYKG
jgi:predicted DNA-binding helix-hairpin-helix protein